MAKIIYFTSKARGTGKTLLTVMTAIAAYKFAQQKTLVVDTMADQTATRLLQKKIPALDTATGIDLLTTTITTFQQQVTQLQASYDYIFLDATTADGLALADQVILLTAADAFALRSAQRLQASITPIKFSGIIQTAIFDRIDVIQPSKDIAPQDLFSLPLANLGGFTDEHRRSGIDIDDEDDEFAWAYFAEVFNELTERSAFITANGSLTGFTYTPKYVDDTGITAAGYALTF
ncbi:hypothetical protein ACLUXD_10900 [Loigolactobacillus coryniformis subsp. coryniformis]|jgi:hypothetical protein|uniref:hypothetical protein n=1 Tax=Loigolactobacillus coryniformis TaxID=1610 RepID=UPI001C5F71C1|nr:hypothetical protein [Loigolactobacillus coryniformis]MBW4803480.1 hypothetical protein [Loigolactobacillus coryniformis subsp. torquens]MBW4806176.1 hypothetical protein [Loigolactobacillus coryniformis subsp. torquens]MDT3391837.1 hypothetical protein [Bacillota bacterium]